MLTTYSKEVADICEEALNRAEDLSSEGIITTITHSLGKWDKGWYIERGISALI